ncbi:archaea-specific SMC-related protein [Haloarchaeobius sp. DFWS5]|uniref:archaea-specific SMC-related protein n=1 Tax=Haloarchaeobius sp. DFWS5 TaxID=3446114 RepID=UPI003EB86D61
MKSRTESSATHISVRNIGGIAETQVDLTDGVNVLAGRNATNRTSFLQAIMAALGSENVSLKGDADEGSVELRFGGETYRRTLDRRNGSVSFEGSPYLDDPELADLFAFLLESNDARRAVARGDDLRELIMRPVDTNAIEAEITQLEAEKRDLDERLSELEDLERRLPQLESRKTELTTQIEEKRAELAELEEEISAMDQDVEDSRDEQAALEDALSDLRSLRSDLEDVRYQLDTERESLDRLREEKSSLEAERADLPDSAPTDDDDLDAELSRLRERIQTLDAEINELQSTIQFNEDMLEEGGEPLRAQDDNGSVTDALVGDDEVVCWTCGTEVSTDQIESTVEQLRELRRRKVDDRNDLKSEVSDLKERRESLSEERERIEQVEEKLARTTAEIDRREGRVEDLTDRRSELEDEIGDQESTVENLEDEEFEEVLDLHREANQLEFEIGRLEDELDEVTNELGDVDDRLESRETYEDRRESIQEELEELRTRIDRIEADAVDEFNDQMETVLDLLDYANIERIWIERTTVERREGRRKVEQTAFDLHVVRVNEEGTAYEDTVSNLSESEREVTGLVFALAGYLVHEVYDVVPFVLMDSLEAIDSARIADLVEYFGEYADHLVVALLEEDAAALPDSYHRVREI